MSRRAVAAVPLALALAATVLASLSASAAGATDSSYWSNRQEGWFWYQDPPVPKKPRREAPARPQGGRVSTAAKDLASFKDFQRRMEEALQMSVINPSDENVLNYLTLWQEAKTKASVFTDVAQAIAWRTPSVNDDFLGVRPTSPAATQAFDRQREGEQTATVAGLARTHGLFFFFRSDCPYCHAMAPMLKQFEAKYGFTVYAVSMDGGGLPDYPRPQRDNGIAARLVAELGIPPEEFQVPFTVLAQPGTREILPVGFGVMTASDMVERIDMVMRLRAQQREPVGGRAVPRRGRPNDAQSGRQATPLPLAAR